jgi:hypothetical protein
MRQVISRWASAIRPSISISSFWFNVFTSCSPLRVIETVPIIPELTAARKWHERSGVVCVGASRSVRADVVRDHGLRYAPRIPLIA